MIGARECLSQSLITHVHGCFRVVTPGCGNGSARVVGVNGSDRRGGYADSQEETEQGQQRGFLAIGIKVVGLIDPTRVLPAARRTRRVQAWSDLGHGPLRAQGVGLEAGFDGGECVADGCWWLAVAGWAVDGEDGCVGGAEGVAVEGPDVG